MGAPVGGQRRFAGRREVAILVDHLARRRHVEPAEDVEQRRLARARRTEQHDELAGEQVEVDAAQRLDGDLAHPIDLREGARDEDGDSRLGGGFGHGRRNYSPRSGSTPLSGALFVDLQHRSPDGNPIPGMLLEHP